MDGAARRLDALGVSVDVIDAYIAHPGGPHALARASSGIGISPPTMVAPAKRSA